MPLRKVFLTGLVFWATDVSQFIWPWVKLTLAVLRHWELKDKIRFKKLRYELTNYYSFTQIILRVNNSSKVWAPCLEMIGRK